MPKHTLSTGLKWCYEGCLCVCVCVCVCVYSAKEVVNLEIMSDLGPQKNPATPTPTGARLWPRVLVL